MEPEGSLPCTQELATCPYREPDQSILLRCKQKEIRTMFWLWIIH